MRIINTGYSPKYLSYGVAMTGGKTLQPGQESRELPLSYIHSELLWKDIDRGTLQIRFNDKDRQFLNRAVTEGDRAITLQQPPAPPAPPPKPAPKPPPPVLQPVLNDPVPEGPVTPGQQAVNDMMKGLGYQDLTKQTGAKSIKDLMQANSQVGVPAFTGGTKASMKDIQTHIGGLV